MGNIVNVKSKKHSNKKIKQEYSNKYVEDKKKDGKCIIMSCTNKLYKDTIYCFQHGVKYDPSLQQLYINNKNKIKNNINKDLEKKLNK